VSISSNFLLNKFVILQCLVLQSVHEVEETWRILKFNVQRYMKGTSERGYILGTIDEVLQTLDDNAMQLQGILSSRFIGPFLNSVQNWEKALSHISEVLEVRTTTALLSLLLLALSGRWTCDHEVRGSTSSRDATRWLALVWVTVCRRVNHLGI